MRLIFPVALSLALLFRIGLSAEEDIVRPQHVEVCLKVVYAYSGSKFLKGEWCTTPEAVSKQPQWDGLSGPVPLAPNAASSIALLKIKERFSSVKEWYVSAIRLSQLVEPVDEQRARRYPGVWFYEVRLVPKDEAVRNSLSKEVGELPLTQIILLDGSVVTPRRSEEKMKGVNVN